MNRKIIIAAIAGIATLGLAATIPAVAQQAGNGPGYGMDQGKGPGVGHGPMKAHFDRDGRGGPGGRMCDEDHSARMAGMIAYAEAKLKITDAQRDAWNAVVTAVKSGQAAKAELCTKFKPAEVKPGEAPVKPTVPERLERMQAFAALHNQQLTTVTPAVKALYEKLTPEQKAIADGMFNHGPGFGHGGFGHGGPGGKHG